MKRTFFILILAYIATFSAQAQITLTPHFTEQSKKIVIPKYAQVYPEIHDGLIAIYNEGRMLYVDATGKYVVGTDFPITVNSMTHTGYFSGGVAITWYKNPKDYSSFPCIIYTDGSYREVPAEKPKDWYSSYSVISASDFCDGYAIVRKGDFMGFRQVFIDKNGKEVFPALVSKGKGTMGDANIYPVCENRRVYYNAELGKYGYADEKGVIVIKPQFDKAQSFNEGMAAVMFEEGYTKKWGFIDLTGKLVIPATYKLKPGRFSEGLAAVRIGSSESDYEMAYIDKTGKRVIENKTWDLNEFHNGYAWVGTGCDKLFVWNDKFEEVRDVTKDFYHGGNGFGTCMFRMYSGKTTDRDWGFDFPEGKRALNQGGMEKGAIFAPDGTIVLQATDANGNDVMLHDITEGGLLFCEVRIENEPRLKEKSTYLSCFINQKGEIVFYFQEGVEGFEGPTPVKK